MGVMDKLRRVLGLVEGHEDKVAREVSKRTSVSEEQARKGISKVQEAVRDGTEGRNRN